MLGVCVWGGGGGGGAVCVHACALRIVSVDKILRFKGTLLLLLD